MAARLAAIPRHLFVPRWWAWSAPGPGLSAEVWELREGHADPAAWLDTAYADASLVTRVGPFHADHAKPGDQPTGTPTSSATLPSLTVRMLQHACLADDSDVLEIGTGSGYGCAVLCERLGDHHVTSVDVDGYSPKPLSAASMTSACTRRWPPVMRPARCRAAMTGSSPRWPSIVRSRRPG